MSSRLASSSSIGLFCCVTVRLRATTLFRKVTPGLSATYGGLLKTTLEGLVTSVRTWTPHSLSTQKTRVPLNISNR